MHHVVKILFRYKYTYMEEMLSNIAGARQIFERWMEWEPDEQAWHSYINMELRYKEIDRARSIYERYVMVHPEVKNWVKFAKFEERQSNIGTYSVYYITPNSRFFFFMFFSFFAVSKLSFLSGFITKPIR